MLVVNTELIKVTLENGSLVPRIKMADGGILELKSFKADLQGYIAALGLATEVLAGKFWPSHVVKDNKVLSSNPNVKLLTQSEALDVTSYK